MSGSDCSGPAPDASASRAARVRSARSTIVRSMPADADSPGFSLSPQRSRSPRSCCHHAVRRPSTASTMHSLRGAGLRRGRPRGRVRRVSARGATRTHAAAAGLGHSRTRLGRRCSAPTALSALRTVGGAAPRGWRARWPLAWPTAWLGADGLFSFFASQVPTWGLIGAARASTPSSHRTPASYRPLSRTGSADAVAPEGSSPHDRHRPVLSRPAVRAAPRRPGRRRRVR